MDKALGMSLEPIRKVLAEAASSFDTRILQSTAKVLSTAQGAALREFYVKFLDNKDPVVRSYGIRGIAGNHFADLRDRIKTMSETDPNPGTRREAEVALGKL